MDNANVSELSSIAMVSCMRPRRAHYDGPLTSTVLELSDHQNSKDSGLNSVSYSTSAARDSASISSHSLAASVGDSMVNFGPESRLVRGRLPCYGQEAQPQAKDTTSQRPHRATPVYRYKLRASSDSSTNSDTSLYVDLPLCNRGIAEVKSKITYKALGRKLKKLTKKLQRRGCTS